MKTKTLIALLFGLVLSACSKSTPTPNPSVTSLISLAPTTTSLAPVKSIDTVVGLKTTHGTIVIKLFRDLTPNTVKNFLTKVNAGFYNGLTFHRVIADFMAQGGDPKGDGTGGGTIKSEINSTPFVRGSLGLARSPGNKDVSNDSQFFICFTTDGCQHLTNDYVNFGQVISGLDVLNQIKQGDNITEITQNTK
ncbi:MAG: peptidylprolyl isomerase [Candidatus Shapirobacteria bacterium]|nr:peptidylprolyl isomerase [Candidatus Shapirobacteria bacterium]